MKIWASDDTKYPVYELDTERPKFPEYFFEMEVDEATVERWLKVVQDYMKFQSEIKSMYHPNRKRIHYVNP